MLLSGACHCGAIRVSLEASMPPADLPLRSCQCSFCRRHGSRTTSDPASQLEIVAARGALNRYRFGRKAVDVVLCGECGVYLASLLTDSGRLLSTLNVAGADLPGFEGRAGEPAVYDHETDNQRLERRRARWTPTTLVEASPSA